MSNKPKPLFVSFDRSWAGYTGMAFGIAFLGLVTFGLYKPYGITHTRRALYNNIYIGGNPLAYTGSAASLSAVSFYPSLAFLFLLLVPGVLQFMVSLQTAVMIGVVQVLLVMAFYQYREFLERQYHLSNISWRGESFTLTGSAWRSMWISLGFQIAGLLTLGFTSLWRRLWLARRDYGGLYYGRQKVQCDIAAAPLLPSYLAGWACSLAGLYFIWLFIREDALMVWQDMLSPMMSGVGAVTSAVSGNSTDFYGGALGLPGMDMMSDPETAAAQLSAKVNAVFTVLLGWPMWVTWRMVCLSLYEARWWQVLSASLAVGPYRVIIESEPVVLTLLNTVWFNINFIMANLTRPFSTFSRIRYFTKRLIIRENMAE